MKYREQLPEDCPPRRCGIDTGNKRGVPTRALIAAKQKQISGLSALNDRTLCSRRLPNAKRVAYPSFARRTDAEKRLRLQKMRGRKICRLRLSAGAGHIQQTGRKSHYTWWPFADYDILAQCTVEST